MKFVEGGPLDQVIARTPVSLRRAAELSPVPVRFQERVLNQVGGIRLSLQPASDLEPGQQREIAAIPLQEIAHGEGNDLVLMCYMSQDFKEGMEAFLGKRKPVWKGR